MRAGPGARIESWRANTAEVRRWLTQALGRGSARTLARVKVLASVGRLAHVQQDSGAALVSLDEALRLARELDEPWWVSWLLHLLGNVDYRQGDCTSAWARLREGIAAQSEIRWGWGLCTFFSSWATIAVVAGQPERAVRLSGAAQSLSESTGAPAIPLATEILEPALLEARRHLGGDRFDAEQQVGRRMSLDEAIAEALAVEAPPSRGPSEPDVPMRDTSGGALDLTDREAQVLRLIVAGKTTREIAYALSVSTTTVERHITHLYGKIGARGRADATAYALHHGLARRPEQGDDAFPHADARMSPSLMDECLGDSQDGSHHQFL